MMTDDNLYDKLCSFKNLLHAYTKALKGKSSKWYIKEFSANLDKNLIELESELMSMKYKPRRMKTFVICNLKTRVISASDFRDRVVHHALCNIIQPIFEKTFIYDSYANRKGKGTHAALKRFDAFKRKASDNGKLLPFAKDGNMISGYALKAVIKHYFDKVDHDILMKILSRKIRDEKVLWLIKRILDNHSRKIAGKGMPIGNLTSQFFANVYLNELDYFVKHKLKAKYYIRYVDDFVILHESKETLESYKYRISEFLRTIRLELHPEKSKIIPLHRGVTILGFRVFYNYKLPKKSNMRLMNRRLEQFIGLYKNGVMKKEEVLEKIEGWNAYAVHGNTFKLRKHIMKKLSKVIEV